MLHRFAPVKVYRLNIEASWLQSFQFLRLVGSFGFLLCLRAFLAHLLVLDLQLLEFGEAKG